MNLENRPDQPADATQNNWVEVNPPELTPDRKIHRGNATRSAYRLFSGLDKLGLKLTKPYKVSGMDIPHHEATSGQYNILFVLSTLEVPSPNVFTFNKNDIVRDSTPNATSNSYYSIEADMDYDDQPYRMLMHISPKDYDPYILNLIMPASIPSVGEVLLESLPSNFTSVGFAYDLTRNPQHRERLSALSKKRVPAEIIDNNFNLRSSVRGHESSEGINAEVHLYLQNPNTQNYLKCYEVEIFSKDGNKNPENTTELAPESIWQDKENHYCMIGASGSYPFIPLDIDRVANLVMHVNFPEDSQEFIPDFQSLPISIDGSNQWYASGKLGNGKVELMHKPEWQDVNTMMVYRQSAKARITSGEIQSVVVEMSNIKKALTERLAA